MKCGIGIGFGGDIGIGGDDTDAIARVEDRFGVRFWPEQCVRFPTAGDVWEALAARTLRHAGLRRPARRASILRRMRS
jgi:hypothetical protein